MGSALQPGDLLSNAAHHAILFDAWEPDYVRFSYYSFGSTPVKHRTRVSLGDATVDGWPTGD
ncbi:MAG: hypothetical protein HKP61_13240 [Dactylosporangium sp.]|nr:hypothetical protein [Dactylosporangium sp.]NNJ61881.1 hypothetical protein [Dactylosporangium sp.]